MHQALHPQRPPDQARPAPPRLPSGTAATTRCPQHLAQRLAALQPGRQPRTKPCPQPSSRRLVEPCSVRPDGDLPARPRQGFPSRDTSAPWRARVLESRPTSRKPRGDREWTWVTRGSGRWPRVLSVNSHDQLSHPLCRDPQGAVGRSSMPRLPPLPSSWVALGMEPSHSPTS